VNSNLFKRIERICITGTVFSVPLFVVFMKRYFTNMVEISFLLALNHATASARRAVGVAWNNLDILAAFGVT
jgi:hypothetical protein